MKASDSLHRLIFALNQVEQMAFRKHLADGKKGKEGLYLKLFLGLCKQEIYDEHAIKKQFQGTSFGKSLAFPKSHLYDTLLEFFIKQPQSDNKDERLRSDLSKIEFLADKGLPDQALEQISKSLKFAIQIEDSISVLQLLRLKRRQIMRIQSTVLGKEMEAISHLEAFWGNALANEQKATRLHDDCYTLFQEVRRKAKAGEDPRLLEFAAALDQLLSQENLCFTAKVTALRAYSHVHHMRENFAEVHNAYQAEIQVWDANPLQIQYAQLRYVRLIGQWLTSKALIKDHEGLFSEIKRLRRRNDLNHSGKAEVFQVTSNLELYYYLNAGKAAQALPIIPAISAGLQRFDQQLPPSTKLAFYYNIALVNWFADQYLAALEWIGNIKRFENSQIRKDIRAFAPILEKVLFYDLGDIGKIESWFRALKYRQKKQNQSLRLEIIVFQLIQTLVAATNQREEAIAFEAFLAELDTFAQEPGVSKLGIQELKIWVGRKMKS